MLKYLKIKNENFTTPFHNNLLAKEWYREWHDNPHHKHVHYLIFFVTLFVSSIAIYSSALFNLSYADEIICVSPQILVDNVCTDPQPTQETSQTQNSSCDYPQILVDNVCADLEPAQETSQTQNSSCDYPQILSDNVCVDPAPAEVPVPEVPTCVSPQVLVDNVCTDPAPVEQPVVPVVEQTSPFVTSVTSPILSGTFHSGVVPIIISFNKQVYVSGTPQLILSTGSPATTALDYKIGSSTSRLFFLYHIVSGNYSSHLNYNSSYALVLNGGEIKDKNGNAVNLILPDSNSSNSLLGNSNIIIDSISKDGVF